MAFLSKKPNLKLLPLTAMTAIGLMVNACSSGSGSNTGGDSNIESIGSNSSSASSSSSSSSTSSNSSSSGGAGAVDLTDQILLERSTDCADYTNQYQADVTDIQRAMIFSESVVITNTNTTCTITSNNIPNHNFNDQSASFATPVAEVSQSFTLTRTPTPESSTSPLAQSSYDGVMLNGVPLDLLSAGCYDPTNPRADNDGNTAIGCTVNDGWLLDPLGTAHKFGADQHNAHTQPDGSYHYHGNPNALFDTNPGPNGSPVIGFAADGYPIYGSYFLDPFSGQVRKAVSGYTLKPGTRPGPSNQDPGGAYDGTYIDDWEFTDGGDLDECNGMTLDNQYGYYVTDSYPWVIKCLRGSPHHSFDKRL